MRFVHLTPPGSACSISIGTGLGSDAAPGSVRGMQMVVDDLKGIREELAGRGVEVSEIQEFPWGHVVFFTHPDGHAWALQYLPDRAQRA